MKKRKFLAGLLMASAIVSLASCGGGQAPAGTGTSTPAQSTSSAPAGTSSAAPAATSSSQAAATSSTVTRTLQGLTIPSGSRHTTQYELVDGKDVFSTEGLQVNAVYNTGVRIEPVNLAQAEITLTKDAAPVQLTDNKFTEAGTYVVTVAYSGKSTSYNVVVKNEQYKAESVIEISQGVADNAVIVDDFHGTVKADGAIGHTESDKDIYYNNVKQDLSKSYKVKQGVGTLLVTPKVDCQFRVVCTAAKNMNFQCINKADATDKQDGVMMAPAGSNDAEKMTSVIHEDVFNLKAGVTYEITNASTSGSAYVFDLAFVYEVDKASVVTASLDLAADKEVEFELTGENALNLAAPQGLAVKKVNTLGFTEDTTDYTVSVANKETEAVVTSITEAGVYTITVTADGVSASYDVTVVDASQPLSAIEATATTTVFYGEAPTVADLGTLTVTGTRGGNTVTLTADDYTVTLVNADDTDAATFAAAGKYRVKVTAEEVDGFIDIYYETIENVEFVKTAAKTQVKTGSTTYASNVSAKATYTNNANAATAHVTNVDVTVVGYYSDAECANAFESATAAFASDGTVYVKLTAAGANDVLEVTVANTVEYDIHIDATKLTTGDEGVQADAEKGVEFVEDKSEEKATATADELGNFFTQTGDKVVKRSGQFKDASNTTNYTSACTALETSQNVGLEFTIESAATLTLKLQSTSSKNKSAFKLVKVTADGEETVAADTAGTVASPTGSQTTGYEFDNNTYQITGSSVSLTYTNLEAGTYKMMFISDKNIDGGADATYGRGGRFLEISVSNKAAE